MNPTSIRVLHVVAGMARGGLETWLMNVMRRIDRGRVQFDFCTSTDRPCDYDAEIRALGGHIIPCLWGRSMRRFSRLFRQILKAGDYDIVHAHPYNFAGLIVRVAAQAGVRHRFAHLHTTSDGRPTTFARVIYRRLMRYLVRRHATRICGCSRGALDAFLGPDWQTDPRAQVIYYGVDLDPLAVPADRDGVRAELGLARDAVLLIHVGRFVEAKNHQGLVEIFRLLRENRKDAHLALVGDGELMPQVREQVQRCGLGEGVHFLGVRADIARLMKASDVTVMPSIREGMPLTMIEATAAALPIVITDLPGTREANEVCCQARLIPSESPPSKWVEAVADALRANRPDAQESLERVRRSPFSSASSAKAIERFYWDCAPPAR